MEDIPDFKLKVEQPRITDFESAETRRRLGPPAMEIFSKIALRWKITDEDACLLLGIDHADYRTILNASESRLLEADTLRRISYLVGIFKALNILYNHSLAVEWICLPNSNALFEGISPLRYMQQGGIPAMRDVRRLLDACCAGN